MIVVDYDVKYSYDNYHFYICLSYKNYLSVQDLFEKTMDLLF